MIASLRLYAIAAPAAVLGAAGIYFWLRSRRKSAQEIERERRQRIAAFGRITDGTVMDVCEIPPQASGADGRPQFPTQLLIFNYDVAGVTYDASQDVTTLRQFIDLHTCRLGLPTSVKYDPQNPGNSIVIAEGWSGLRKWNAPPAREANAAPASNLNAAAAAAVTPSPATESAHSN